MTQEREKGKAYRRSKHVLLLIAAFAVAAIVPAHAQQCAPNDINNIRQTWAGLSFAAQHVACSDKDAIAKSQSTPQKPVNTVWNIKDGYADKYFLSIYNGNLALGPNARRRDNTGKSGLCNLPLDLGVSVYKNGKKVESFAQAIGFDATGKIDHVESVKDPTAGDCPRK